MDKINKLCYWFQKRSVSSELIILNLLITKQLENLQSNKFDKLLEDDINLTNKSINEIIEKYNPKNFLKKNKDLIIDIKSANEMLELAKKIKKEK